MPIKKTRAKPDARRFRETARAEEVLAIEPKAFFFMYGCGDKETTLTDDGIAVVNIEGPLEQKGGYWFDSYESIVARVQEAADDEASRAIVMRFDSPGGDVAGLYESVKAIVKIKEASGKPFYAYANELAASAAYALACSCDEIYMPEPAGVGSIGVISMLGEMTERDRKEGFAYEIIASGERKPDGNPHIKISDGARKRVQSRVDSLAAMFFALVADSRGLSAKKVEALEADVFYGADAVQTGLADGLASWPDFLAMVGTHTPSLDNSGKAASRSTSQPTARSVEKVKTMGLLALKKAKADAIAALAKAKTEAACKRAGADLNAACVALAKAEAVVEAKKMKKTKYVEETVDDGEKDDDDDGGDDDDDAKSEEDDSAQDDADDGSAEDDAEDGKKAVKLGGKLGAQLAKLTGKTTAGGIIGTVRAAIQGHKRVAKVEAELRAMKVDGLIAAGTKAGKIEPKLVEFCTRMGQRDPEELEAYLEAKAPSVRTTDDKAPLPKELAGFGGTLTTEEASIASRMGLTSEEVKAIKDKATTTNGAPAR